MTSAQRDGTLSGPDLPLLESVLEAGLPVIAAGGIAALDDLRVLRELGCEGAVTGSAIWLDRFTLTEALSQSRKVTPPMTPVRIPPMLRDQVEGQREVLGEGETVRQVLEDLATRYPALRANLFEQGDLSPFVNVYVGRDDVRTLEGLDTPVGGSSVILLPAMAGGR